MADELWQMNYINHLIYYPIYSIFYSYLRRSGKKETSTAKKLKINPKETPHST